MANDPSSVDQRQRRGGIYRPLLAPARPESPWDHAAADVLPAKLPAWPFRRPPRAGARPEADDAAPERAAARLPETPPRRPATGGAEPSRQFAADRAAARYAPEGAGFLLDDRSLTVLTVSMSGISIRWDAGRLPAVGSRIEGEVVPGATVGDFAAAFDVVRVEPERRLVAGRFAPLSGPAIDRLLSWLSQLDRAAGKG